MGFADNAMPTESLKMVSSSNHINTEVKSERLPMVNADGSSSGCPPKYKRRRVSAVRDFPPGCGPSGNCDDTSPRVEALSVSAVENLSLERNYDSERDDCVRASGSGLEPFGKSVIVSPTGILEKIDDVEVRREEVAVSSYQMNRVLSESVEPLVMQLPEAPETLNTASVVEAARLLEPETVDVAKDPNVMNVATAMENVLVRKYPPRRRISAVRDFPPHCGRNAPSILKEKHPNVLTSTEDDSFGQMKSETTEKLVLEVRTAPRNVRDVIIDENNGRSTLGDFSESTLYELQAAPEALSISEASRDELGPSSDNEIQVARDKIQSKGFESKSDGLRKEIVVYVEDKKSEKKLLKPPGSNNLVLCKGSEISLHASGRSVVLGLAVGRHCPWSKEKGLCKRNNLSIGTKGRKDKRNDFLLLERPKPASRITMNYLENSGETFSKKNPLPTGNEDHGLGLIVGLDKEDSHEYSGECDDFKLVRRSQSFSVSLPPSGPSSSCLKGVDNGAISTRKKVRETLRLFQTVCRKLLQEEEAKPKEKKSPYFRVDLQAAKILKEKGMYVNIGKQFVGSIPGVEIGDEFQYRIELNIIGIHRILQGGIDYKKEGGKIIATSIVASGGYDDDTDESDVLIYSGQGGNMMSADKEPTDQKLERGNLALKNSIDVKNPVRVIFGDTKASDSSEARSKIYIYDGLYEVKQCWQEIGSHGKLVFKFKLVRVPNQPELAWKMVKKSKKFKVREGICVNDISQGKETISICAVNTIDDEKPPPFKYVTKIIYPEWYRPTPTKGCGCINGCSEMVKCSCVEKNGGEIPFNHNGAIVQAKPLVFECGPSCKCPPSCHNRVSQHGIRFQLEIFKTGSRGWGVRSLNSIPSGSFICEYAGELLEEKEAEARTGNDEYLFDIGNQYDSSLTDGLLAIMPEAHSIAPVGVEICGFTIDAAQYGNVGRFINHSCSPNLYAQNVLYDHDDKRIPHIMFFAAENIPPLQELTYDYNYTQDQVLDSSGNIKKKRCYCGSPECTGWMY